MSENINTFCEDKDRKRILVEPSEIYIMPENSIHWDDIEKK